MRPDGAVISRDIADNRSLGFAEAVIALRRYPFGLQASEEPLHWDIILAVILTTHTLLYLAAPQCLPIFAAGIVTPLVAVEHHACWPTTQFPGHLQRFDRQCRVRRRRYGPAHRFTGEQVENHCQISPAFTRPDIGHIAASDLVRRGNRELAVEMIRYFNVFVSAAFVLVRRYLATGDIQLFHLLTGQPAPHFDARVSGNYGGYASGAGRAAAGFPGLHDLAALEHTFAVGLIRRSLPVPVAAAMDFKSLAQRSDRISRSKPVDYREPLSASDIKSAVAFFRISFSISRR